MSQHGFHHRTRALPCSSASPAATLLYLHNPHSATDPFLSPSLVPCHAFFPHKALYLFLPHTRNVSLSHLPSTTTTSHKFRTLVEMRACKALALLGAGGLEFARFLGVLGALQAEQELWELSDRVDDGAKLLRRHKAGSQDMKCSDTAWYITSEISHKEQESQ
jgi:hypothetical protein